jgi:hypothetical protein
MNYWKRLRWIASIAFALVLLIAFAAAMLHGSSQENSDTEEDTTEQRVPPPAPIAGKGQTKHNSTGL